MRVMAGRYDGPLTLADAVLLKGMLFGDLLVEGDAEVEMKGMVLGNVRLTQGELYVTGIVTGDVVNEGGTLHVTGLVSGKLQTLGGSTDSKKPERVS